MLYYTITYYMARPKVGPPLIASPRTAHAASKWQARSLKTKQILKHKNMCPNSKEWNFQAHRELPRKSGVGGS